MSRSGHGGTPEFGRRHVLAATLGLAASVAAAPARAEGVAGTDWRAAWRDKLRVTASLLGLGPPLLHNPSLLVAGPVDSDAGRWARLLQPVLSAGLRTHDAIQIDASGGHDGVTGANQFETRTAPDGSTALLVPGTAALAWLAGDPRVHFDASRWIPALAALSGGVVVGRVPAGASLSGRTIRLAMAGPSGRELPALLGLSLAGAKVVAVPGLSDPDLARQALQTGSVDAVFLTGADVPRRMGALTAADAGAGSGAVSPIFSIGTSAVVDGDIARDPLLPDVPSMEEIYRRGTGHAPQGPLVTAWRAAAAAARIDTALVLPMLTPAALVSEWRSACRRASAAPAVAGTARERAVAAMAAPDCVPALADIAADETALLALRRWMAETTDWRPA